jgi:hypothetical protein
MQIQLTANSEHRVRSTSIRRTHLRTQTLPRGATSGLMHRSKEHTLFDHLVGGLLKMERHIEPQRFSSLEIYCQFEAGGFLHRQINGFTSLNRPGTNLTGVSIFTFDLGPKRLDIARELVPHAAKIRQFSHRGR